MTAADDVPGAISTTPFAAWSRECDLLEAELPSIQDPAERWFHLVLLTNAMNLRYKVVESTLDDIMEEVDGLSDPDDPVWVESEDFTNWAQPWIERFKAAFDVHKRERDQLFEGLSQEEVERGEAQLDSRFEEIKGRVKAALLENLRALQEQALAARDAKVCPDCAEEIKAAARKCRYCGYRFDPVVGG